MSIYRKFDIQITSNQKPFKSFAKSSCESYMKLSLVYLKILHCKLQSHQYLNLTSIKYAFSIIFK